MADLRPRDVPGYPAAAAAGLLPFVPATPPVQLRRPSAQSAFRRFLVQLGASVVVQLLLLEFVPDHASAAGTFAVLVAGGIVALVLILRWWRAVGEALLAELECGYTTLLVQFGTFGFGEGRRRPGLGWRVPWDFSGVWVLDSSSRVLSAPDPGVDPPGFYPSPSRPGAWELWSGAVWVRRYRSPPRWPPGQHQRSPTVSTA